MTCLARWQFSFHKCLKMLLYIRLIMLLKVIVALIKTLINTVFSLHNFSEIKFYLNICRHQCEELFWWTCEERRCVISFEKMLIFIFLFGSFRCILYSERKVTNDGTCTVIIFIIHKRWSRILEVYKLTQ